MADHLPLLTRREFVRGSLIVAGAAAFPGLLAACSKKSLTDATSLRGLTQQLTKAGAKQDLSIFLGGEDYIEGLENYVAFGMAREQGSPVFGASARVWIAQGSGGEGSPTGPLDATWQPYTKPDAPPPAPQGLDATQLTFPTAGVWQMLVEIETAGARSLGTTAVQVKSKAQASTLLPGARALATKTPTTGDPAGVHPICTRTPPCPFHQVTLAEAITSGKPTAFMVGTPKFCMSRTCGPNLEELILVAHEVGARANFVHAEVYRSDKAEDIQRQAVSPTFVAWKMQSEPWLFLIDASGTITHRYEGPVVKPAILEGLQPLVK